MHYIARDCIAVALSEVRGISHKEAWDILDATLAECANAMAGESDYPSVEAVIADFLSLGEEWAKIFCDSLS